MLSHHSLPHPRNLKVCLTRPPVTTSCWQSWPISCAVLCSLVLFFPGGNVRHVSPHSPLPLHPGPVCVLVAQSYPILSNPMVCSPPGSSVHGLLQARILRVSCHSLLQGIFPTQGSNLGLLHSRQILYPLSHQTHLLFIPRDNPAIPWIVPEDEECCLPG